MMLSLYGHSVMAKYIDSHIDGGWCNFYNEKNAVLDIEDHGAVIFDIEIFCIGTYDGIAEYRVWIGNLEISLSDESEHTATFDSALLVNLSQEHIIIN